MWPFGQRRRGSVPVIDNHLADAAASDDGPHPAGFPSTVDASVESMGTLGSVQSTLTDINGTDPLLLKRLITESESLKGRLDALLTDLHATGGATDSFGGNVDAAYTRIKNTVGQSPDIILRHFTVGKTLRWPALLAFADGMVDNEMVDQDTLLVMQSYDLAAKDAAEPKKIHELAHHSILTVGHIGKESSWDKILDKLTYGSALVFIHGCTDVLVLDTVKFTARSISRPDSEPSIKGPQEAFNDIILTHMNQIRRRIRTPWLHFDALEVGGYTKSTVLVCHIEGLTNPELVAHIKSRVESIDRDYVQQCNEVTSYLTGKQSTLFPLVRLTERVDWAVRDLLNGKVVLMVDNDPFVASMPCTLMDFYQTSQDYVFSAWEATLVRIVRLLGLLLGLYLMPLYIALFSVDPDLVPTKLVLTIAGSRLGIPFPPIMEVIIMWVIIEILREAANRLPKELAVTLGTVGAVVVGTAIVKAGIVDPIMIVIATLSALGLFTSPTFEMTSAWRWLFWGLTFAAYMLGMYGLLLFSVGIVAYICSLESFGVPYFTPFGPLRVPDLADTWIRLPITGFTNRPVANRAVDVDKARKVAAQGSINLYRGQQEGQE